MDAVVAPVAPQASIRFPWRVTPLRLAIGLTFLALALRVIDLGGRSLWLDEAFSAWFSDRSFHYLWTVVPTYEAHPPFHYSVLKLWRSAFGEGTIALRSLSVLLGTLTVPIVFAAALEQERQSPTGQPLLRAGIAAFLVACAPMLVVIGQEARPYALLTFAYAVAILALLRLTREFKEGGAGGWPWWFQLGAATEVTAWSHALGILYAACLALALLPGWLRALAPRGRILRGVITGAGFALLYVPCLLMMMSRTGDWGANWLAWHPSMLLQLVVLYSVPLEALTIGSAVAAIAMLLLYKRALETALATRGWNTDRAMVLLWLGPPMLAALMSALFVPVFLARTLSGTLVPACLAIGAAIARTHDARERRMIAMAICIALLPIAVVVALRPASERWDLASAWLARNVAAEDQVWLYPSDSALPLSHVSPFPGTIRTIPAPFPTLGVKGPIRAGWPAMVSVTPRQAAEFAGDPAVGNVRVIWLVTRQSGIFDPNNDMPRALAKVRVAGPVQEWGYIAVQPFYRRSIARKH